VDIHAPCSCWISNTSLNEPAEGDVVEYVDENDSAVKIGI
jgi:hypothetical protein